jgi:hypothetical protein
MNDGGIQGVIGQALVFPSSFMSAAAATAAACDALRICSVRQKLCVLCVSVAKPVDANAA